MTMFTHNRTLAMLLTASLCAVTPQAGRAGRPRAPQAAKNTPPVTNTPKQPGKNRGLTIGGLHITGMGSTEIANKNELTLEALDKAEGIRIETSDTARHAHILVFAGHVVARKGAKGQGSADMSGNVRYTITEQIAEGKSRILQGTAQRAVYTEADQILHLIRNVNAVLTDPTRFDGPATLRVTTLTLTGTEHYELAGDPGSNDARFTPHYVPPKDMPNPAPDAKSKPPMNANVGSVHVHGFATGHLNVGKDARFDGPLVTMETNNPQTKTQNTFKAPHVTANLEPSQERVEATGGVQFNSLATDPKGNSQRIAGTTSQAVYDSASAHLDLEGSVNATLTNPQVLKEPATLAAGHLLVEVSDEPRYVLTGSPDRTRLAFAPKPGKKKQAGVRQTVPPNAPISTNAEPANAIPTNAAPDNAAPNNAPLPANKAEAQAGGLKAEEGAGNKEKAAEAEPIANRQSPIANQNAPFAFGNIVISAFQTATYVPGKSVVVEGPKVHFTSSDAAAKSYADLLTPHFAADFDQDDSTLTEARATGSVAYKFEQPLKSGTQVQSIVGTARAATFANSDQAQTLRVEGVEKLNIINPELFDDMAKYTAKSPNDLLTYDLTNQNVNLKSPNGDAEFYFAPHLPPEPVKPVTTKSNKSKKKRK